MHDAFLPGLLVAHVRGPQWRSIPGFHNDQHNGTSATIIHSQPVPTGTVIAGLPSPTPTGEGFHINPPSCGGYGGRNMAGTVPVGPCRQLT